MDPVEINAGTHYLRGLRADDRLDDSVALASILGLSPEEARTRIRELDRGWAEETELSWAVCEQTDPTCLALLLYDVAGRDLSVSGAPGIPEPETRFAGPVAAVERFVATFRRDG